MQKGLLLYTGYSGTKYYNPTDEELRLLVEATDEILLIPIVMFNRFTDTDGTVLQVITEEAIANLSADMVAQPEILETIRGEYAARTETYLRANYQYDDYIRDAACYTKFDPARPEEDIGSLIVYSMHTKRPSESWLANIPRHITRAAPIPP